MILSIEDLLGSAISPSAWLSWVPENVLEKLPYDIRCMISNINGLWIISNDKHDIIWSSEPAEIEQPVVREVSDNPISRAFQKMMAAVSPNPDFNPQDDLA